MSENQLTKQVNIRVNPDDWSAFNRTALVKEQGAAQVLRDFIRIQRNYQHSCYSSLTMKNNGMVRLPTGHAPDHLVDIHNALHHVLKAIPNYMYEDPMVPAIEKLLRHVEKLAINSPGMALPE